VIADDLRAGQTAERIRARRLIVVLRRIEPREALLALVDELVEAGARIFEVTFDASRAADDLGALRRRLGDDCLVGAGTVLRAEQVGHARDAGAAFVVAPILDPGVVAASLEAGLPMIPGALTPTEIAAAWSAGATFVKLFPASSVGPSAIRELRGPMPEIELIPTGGVDSDNASAFLEAGAVAVGIGSALVRADPHARRALVRTVSGRAR
jgi:2-dehydro-3-deoxyphosphogluconate aldolase/(4S)-4-hydroxy-2-oxoglutarate aldolase